MGEVARHFSCSLCNSTMVPTPINFRDHGKDWHLVVWLCHQPSCLWRRGASSTDVHRKAGT